MRIGRRRPSPSWNECGELQSHRPMLNVEPVHGTVGNVRGCESCPDAHSRGRDQAIGLMEREPASGERPSPIARTHAFCHPQGCKTQSVEQPPRMEFFAGTQPAPELLDGDDADPRLGTRAPKTRHTRRGRPAAQRVDQDSRIQQQAGHRQRDCRQSPCRCRRTHAPGSSSHSCPVSGRLPSAASISSQRRSSSSPRAISSATNALRLLAPARRSSSATSASSNARCIRMGRR